MRRRAFTVILLSVLLAGPAPAVAADPLTILTENYPPLNYVDGEKLKGAAVEIVRAIKKRLKLPGKILVRPWARAYHLLKTKPDTALFSTTRSAARDPQFKWVGPLAEKKIGMFVAAASGIKLANLDGARPYTIGVQLAGVGMEELKSKGFQHLDPASSAVANLKKLLAGRIDMWYASNATVGGNTKKLGIGVDAVKLVLTTATTFMYIAFNKDTPDAVINRWQKALDGLYAEGAVKAIFAKYKLSYLYAKPR